MYGLSPMQVKSLVPMSIEQLRLEGKKNSRAKHVLMLWFIDASGTPFWFVESEVRALELDQRWPWYMTQNWGIKRINAERRLLSQSCPQSL